MIYPRPLFHIFTQSIDAIDVPMLQFSNVQMFQSNVFFFSWGGKSFLSISPLVHWSIGPLVHWSICPLVHWSIGPLVQMSIRLNFCWSVPPEFLRSFFALLAFQANQWFSCQISSVKNSMSNVKCQRSIMLNFCPYILKVKKSAESTFQFPRICGKSA